MKPVELNSSSWYPIDAFLFSCRHVQIKIWRARSFSSIPKPFALRSQALAIRPSAL